MRTHIDVIAHRGDQTTARENTIAAFEAAITSGADVVEMDVRSTYDHRIVISHEPVWDKELEKLIDVPTLDEALGCCTGKIKVNLEIKPDERITTNVIGIVREHPRCSVTISSSSINILAYVRYAAPMIPLQLINLERSREMTDLLIAGEYGLAGINVPMCSVYEPFIEVAHSYKLKVNAYLINYPAYVPPLVKAGIDGIFTDYPAKIIEIL